MAFAPQYGEHGYEGLVGFCADIQQARHSAALIFSNFGWDKTLGTTGWRIDLTRNGVLLESDDGLSGENKKPYLSLEENHETVFLGEHEEFVWPNTGYGARISNRPAGIPDKSFLLDGDCLEGRELKQKEDKSCSLTVTGLPDLSVSLVTPSEPYQGVGETQNITVLATNLGAGAVFRNDEYALKVTVPTGWTAQTVDGCAVSGQVVTCAIDSSVAASSSHGSSGGQVEFTIPLTVNLESSSGTYSINASLDRSAPADDDNPANDDYETENDQATSTIKLQKRPSLTVRKTTFDDVGSFTITGNNGWEEETITTTEPGVAVRGRTQILSEANVETTITETLPPNWVLHDVICLSMGEGGTVSFNENSFTLSAKAVAADTDIQCSFVNHKIVLTTSKASSIGDGVGVQAGDKITYTLKTTVKGGTTQEKLSLTDTLGDGLEFDGIVDAGPFQTDVSKAPELSFTLPAGAAVGTHSITYRATVLADASGPVSNSATADIGECNPCKTSNPLIEIKSSKSSDVGNGVAVQAGDIITYTLTAVIANGSLSRDLQLKDTLGEGLDFDKVVEPGPFVANTSLAPVLSFTLPAGTGAGTYHVKYTARVRDNAAGSVSNRARADAGECDPCMMSNPLITLKTSKVSDVGDTAGVQAGDTITYTLSAEVSGGTTSRVLVLTDTLGAGLDFGSVVDAGAFEADTSGAPVLSFSLPAGTEAGTYPVTYTATVRPDASGSVSNTATSELGECDPCTTSSPLVVLKSSKSSDVGDGSNVNPGDTITYTLTTKVSGGATTQELLVEDMLGAGLAFGRVVDPGPFLVDASDLPTVAFRLPKDTSPGTYSASYTASVAEDASGALLNVVRVDSGTCSPCSTQHYVSGDVSISKSLVHETGAIKGNAEPGERLTFEIELSNAGSEVDDFSLLDQLDVNMRFVGASDGGRHADGRITWSGLTVPGRKDGVDGTKTVTVEVDVADSISGGAESIANLVKHPGAGDPDCPSAQCVVLPTRFSEFRMTMSGEYIDLDGNGIATPGDVIRYHYQVVNNGTFDLHDVTIENDGPTFNGSRAGRVIPPVSPAATSIKAGDTAEFVVSYVLTQTDIDNASGQIGAVVNSATATGINEESPGEPQRLHSNRELIELTIPAGAGRLALSKIADPPFIRPGEPASFIIRLANNNDAAIKHLQITDVLPVGFRFVSGSAWVDGVPVRPIIDGRSIHFKDLSVGRGTVLEIRLTANALASAALGEHVNSAFLLDRTGKRLPPAASAQIRLSKAPTFSCGDIIGRVFDDRNRNGYPDAGERGLPGVRLASVEGQLVITDKSGGFHIACAAMPAERRGMSFVVKLDERTLPTGYALTTERSRVVRLTSGKTTKINFGASISRVVDLELEDAAFEPGTHVLRRNWLRRLDQLISLLEKEPSLLRIRYIGGTGRRGEAARRIDSVQSLILQRWRSRGNRQRLKVKTQVLLQDVEPERRIQPEAEGFR
ncbi:isopeptide-forming domain-containing fimbrial protein [Nitratireductor sp. GISD-1A_MAKvit]|uniref:isopeptide-forming domain-containing fimbrial protein n=1 Tax=Nitratireductor sp. GISD-1A_MAKvit TaxID=3234198 RepID=UPI0034650551